MVRPMGANNGGSTAALISIRGPPIRFKTNSETWASLRRTNLGGVHPPSWTPDMPIAVGTQAG